MSMVLTSSPACCSMNHKLLRAQIDGVADLPGITCSVFIKYNARSEVGHTYSTRLCPGHLAPIYVKKAG